MCLSLVGFVPLVGSGIAATAKWGSKAFKASKIGSKVIGVGSKVLDFGKTIGRGIARGVSTGSDYVKRVLKSSAGTVKKGFISGTDLFRKSGVHKEFEIFEGSRLKGNFRVNPDQVVTELSKSKVGRETLEYINKNDVKVMLSYEPKVKTINGKNYEIMGHYDPELDVCKTFVTNTVTVERTAQNVIHEVTHRMGFGGTKRNELLARMRQEKHIFGDNVPLSVMRKHYNEVYKGPGYAHRPIK